MTVYLPIIKHLSIAMRRVAIELKKYAPKGTKFVSSPDGADLEILHVIGAEALTYETPAKRLAVLQYCVHSANGDFSAWYDLWRRAALVVSYYNLTMPEGGRLLHTPLGVDGDVFSMSKSVRDFGVMTSGFVSGPGAEAIEEVALAAIRNGLKVFHLGPPQVQGMTPLSPKDWQCIYGVSDENLAQLYRRCKWVSGLRYVEGFELPVIEGLASGCRPFVFDRPDMRQWYEGHVVFVPEVPGEELIEVLADVMSREPQAVSETEREEVLRKFSWGTVARNFWTEVAL